MPFRLSERTRATAIKGARALVLLVLGSGALPAGCRASHAPQESVVAGSHADRVHGQNDDREGDGPRDWHRYPAVVELTGRSEIDAIGDLHGDPGVAAAVLTAAGLIAANPGGSPAYLWTGGTRVLVSVGDLIDKAQDAIGVIDLLTSLEPQAEAAGGRVIVTLGNHEAEFVANPTGEKTALFSAELSRRGYRPAAVAAGQTKYGRWLLTRPVAALIDGWFFCHGGNTNGMSASQIAVAYQRDFRPDGAPIFEDAFLIGPNSLLEAREWWHAGAGGTSAKTLDLDLNRLPARHIVFGHDPRHIRFGDEPAGDRAKGTMVARYDGRIFLIDVGMSHAMGYSPGSLLRIVRGVSDTAVEVTAGGATRAVWP